MPSASLPLFYRLVVMAATAVAVVIFVLFEIKLEVFPTVWTVHPAVFNDIVREANRFPAAWAGYFIVLLVIKITAAAIFILVTIEIIFQGTEVFINSFELVLNLITCLLYTSSR